MHMLALAVAPAVEIQAADTMPAAIVSAGLLLATFSPSLRAAFPPSVAATVLAASAAVSAADTGDGPNIKY
jgi:hypothetical protein